EKDTAFRFLCFGFCDLSLAIWLLRFDSCVLVQRFGLAFCLFEDLYCVLLKRNSAQLKTSLRFVSKVALRKCILSGPYKPTTVLVQAVTAANDSPAIPKHTTVETPMNMSLANRAHFEAEKEAIHLILTGIGDELYSTVVACQTAQEMWEAIKRLQQGESLNIQDPEWSRFVTIGKQQHKLDDVSYHKLFNILKQYQKEVNELCAERLARNANPLALVATAQANQDPYYKTSKSHKSYAPSSKPTIPTRTHTTTRYKGKEIAKPITTPSETVSEEDSDPEQAQRDSDMHKNFALIAKNQRTMNVAGARENVGNPVVQQSGIQCFNCKEFCHFAKECRKPKRVKDSAYHKEKMLLCKRAEKGVSLQAEQYGWLKDTNEGIDEQELEAHYSYMEKIQERSKSVSNTCLVETNDNNVIPDSPNMCDDDIPNDQNDVESDDERVALANLIANLKLDVDENKKIQKQLKKANTTLAQELKECKTILAETCKTLGESNSVQNSCLVALQNKQTEFEKYKAFNDRIVDYDKLEPCNEKASNGFRKERKQYIKIQDSKAKLQDKNIAISELKKLIEQGKEKSVDTKFDRPSVVRQPNAQSIPKPSVLGKPTPFPNSLDRIYFQKTMSVSKANVSECLSKPVTAQTLPQTAKKAVSNTNVLKPGIGTEFLNKTLNAFLKEEGIKHQTSTARTPEQKGIVKRRNRTLVEATRTMLLATTSFILLG
nr:putative ribonuclease H-like domain-containing protein [Tanacetum cinerariifolium]